MNLLFGGSFNFLGVVGLDVIGPRRRASRGVWLEGGGR